MKKYVILLLFLLTMPIAVAYGVTFYNPAWNPQDGIMYEEVLANEPYELAVKADDIAITNIIFYVNKDVKNAGITVYHLKSFPDNLPEISENNTYEVNEIKTAEPSIASCIVLSNNCPRSRRSSRHTLIRSRRPNFWPRRTLSDL